MLGALTRRRKRADTSTVKARICWKYAAEMACLIV